MFVKCFSMSNLSIPFKILDRSKNLCTCGQVSALDNEGTKAIRKEYPICSKVKIPLPLFIFDSLRRYQILSGKKGERQAC